MKVYRVQYARQATKDLKALDSHIALKIFKKIDVFAADIDGPLRHAKELKGSLAGLYRFRIGDYRAVFQINGEGEVTVLSVLSVKHRKEVYRK